MTVTVSPPVPEDIQPAEVDLAVTALLLRAGLYGEEVPTCETPSLIRAIDRIAHRLTWRPFERPA